MMLTLQFFQVLFNIIVLFFPLIISRRFRAHLSFVPIWFLSRAQSFSYKLLLFVFLPLILIWKQFDNFHFLWDNWHTNITIWLSLVLFGASNNDYILGYIQLLYLWLRILVDRPLLILFFCFINLRLFRKMKRCDLGRHAFILLEPCTIVMSSRIEDISRGKDS